MDLNKKGGFTLAELMIVFTVIGVLTAILVPTLFAASPDQAALKAKKAYNTLTRVVENLTNGEPYDANDGVLDATPFFDAAQTNLTALKNNYFCNNVSELLNLKVSNCNDTNAGNITVNASNATNDDGSNQKLSPKYNTSGTVSMFDYQMLQKNLDNLCKNYFENENNFSGNSYKSYYSFITNDGVGWIIQKYDFANSDTVSVGGVTSYTMYGAVCINTGELKTNDSDNIYAIGVNRVGKILVGQKLQDLIDEDFEEAAE